MGRNLKLPKYVHAYFDIRNKPRHYFRRAGFKRVPLPGLPWSPEFMAAYEAALAGQLLQVGAARVKPGTIRALAVSYLGVKIGTRSLGQCQITTHIAAMRMIARSAPSPSSPAPSARRWAALGLDCSARPSN
jgi:hypothetical protein